MWSDHVWSHWWVGAETGDPTLVLLELEQGNKMTTDHYDNCTDPEMEMKVNKNNNVLYRYL